MKKDSTMIQVFVSQKSDNSHGVDQIIEDVISSLKESQVPQAEGRRRDQRWAVNMMGVVQIFLQNEEVAYLPVMICNISRSGILLELVDKGYLHENMLHEIDEFNLLFLPPGQTKVISVVCQPRRVEVNNSVLMGASFLHAEEDDFPLLVM